MKTLTISDIDWELIATQDDCEVRGNALVSGDEDEDKRVEDEIIERLNNGDEWAWASVEVRGTFNGLVASDYLGCCSYANADDFKTGGYFDDMQENVLEQLQAAAESIVNAMVEV